MVLVHVVAREVDSKKLLVTFSDTFIYTFPCRV